MKKNSWVRIGLESRKKIMKQYFGTVNGQDAYLYTLENDKLIFKVTDFGATVVSIIDKGTGIDILKGYDSVEGYWTDPGTHVGGFIGRTANRIRGAVFVLNGSTYHITANEKGITCLHGGNGFDRHFFQAEEKEQAITFSRLSPDGEEGFPGNLHVEVTYTLKDNTVSMHVEAVSDADTIFCFTNHNYYNLDGSDTIRTHKLQIFADRYADNDATGISSLPLKEVDGTPFDFRKGKLLEEGLDAEDPQIQFNQGFDNHYAVNGAGLRPFAVLEGEKLVLKMSSDLPGMHLYSANFFEITGKGGHQEKRYSAVCLEPEYFPNAINEPKIEDKPILRKGEKAQGNIVWALTEK
jgi:aldose 1-epimerase